MPEDLDSTLSRLMSIGQVGTEMVVPIGIGFLLDYYLFHTSPLFMIVGALVGLVGGVIHLIVLNRPKRP